MDLSVVIQAGGESRRMGRNKALVPFLGQPLIERMIQRLQGLGEELFITAQEPEALAFLRIPCEPDLEPGRGALGGLYTALSLARHDRVAVVACDLPFVNPHLLRFAVERLEGADLAIPEHAGGWEPFHAVYRRTTCLAAIRAAMDEGQWRVQSWFSKVQVQSLQPDSYRHLDPDGMSFFNVNTPEELMTAQQWATSNLL